MSTRGGKRCPRVFVAESQQSEDQPDAVDPPPLVGDTETGSPHDDYNGSNSGGDEQINLAEDDDSDLDEQSAGQHADIRTRVRGAPTGGGH